MRVQSTLRRLCRVFFTNAALFLGISAHALADDLRFFGIGTGGVAGTYYPIGGLVADVISHPPGARPCDRGGSCGVPGLVAVASSSDGSVTNVRAIAAGQLDSGFAQSDVAYFAYHGDDLFAGEAPLDNLRLIASLYVESAQVVMRYASSMARLSGKRVSIDGEGSGTLPVARKLLAAHGLDETSFTPHYVQGNRAVQMMRSGDLDGYITVSGYPTPSVVEATRDLGASLVSLEADAVEALTGAFPYFSAKEIPADTYAGQPEQVETIGVVAQWVTSTKADDELIYQITKALWHPNARALLDNGHRLGSAITLDSALDGAAIPLHPGAERFYREAGMIE